MLRKYFSKSFFIILLIGIFVRIIVLLWSVPLNINGDQTRYEDWAQTAHIYGLADTYSGQHVNTVINNMPPGSLYIISANYETYILIGKVIAKVTHTAPGSIQFVNSYLLHVMMRIPSILTDIFMGILAYLLVKREKNERKSLLAASLILFNPVIFYNSSIWGQMDSLNNFFFLLSLFFAFKKNYIFSIISFSICLYIKISLLPLLPFYFIFLLFHSKYDWRKILIGIVLSLLLIVIATLPISHQPIEWLVSKLPIMARGELQNITIAAFNFWWAVTCGPIHCPGSLPVINDRFLGLTLNFWGYFLFSLSTLPLLYMQIKSNRIMIDKKNAFVVFGLVMMTAFLFLPKMHDRYLYPFFPLFAVAIALSDHLKKYLSLYIGLIIIHMGNVIYSYFPAFYPSLIYYEILYSNLYRWSISFMTVLVSLIIYFVCVRDFKPSIQLESNLTRPKPNRKKREK